MKLIAVSQRVDILADRNERRDALDQRYTQLLAAAGFATVPVPNIGAAVADWLAALPLAGILLSGGNDLVEQGGDAPERDATETALLAYAQTHALPLAGICRGLQFLAVRFGATLTKKSGHVASRHLIDGAIAREVNSYHCWCLDDAPAGWNVLGRCADGSIEAMRHTRQPLLALMWHPERESRYHPDDIALLAEHWNRSR
jgi:putative glutamine amidotransferase